jgi:DNA-binding PadR family transcriptional regulator
MHGYGLKTEYEAATADVWPLNVGQVYTTLSRLERDGLVGPALPVVPGLPPAQPG